MEDFLRVITLILFYLFFILVSSLTGLLFNLHLGFFIGLVFSLLVLAVFFKYGEKFILLMAKARYVTDDEALVNQVKNFCTHLEMDEIKVYWSHVYYNNVYFINSYKGTPSIIIGKEAYQKLSKNELNSLIYATLLRIKSAESKHRSTINLITFCLFWWVFLIDKLTKDTAINNGVQIFLYPAFYLRNLFYKKSDDTKYFDEEIFKHDQLKRDYISAIFKINKLELCQPFSVGAFVLSGLSHTTNISSQPFMQILLQNETTIEERIKHISGNLR